MSTGYTWPSRFLISDIRALWRSALSTRVPECQKLKMTPLHFKGLNKIPKALVQYCQVSVLICSVFRCMTRCSFDAFQSDLKFLGKCWKLAGRPTFCMIIREDNIRSDTDSHASYIHDSLALLIFTLWLRVMQCTVLLSQFCLPVCPSVCLSDACIVTKLNDALRIFWHHTKRQSV